MGKKRILLLFPDGVGIRNYLYSDVFKNTNAELILYHNFDQKTIADIKNVTGIEGDVVIPKYTESVKEKFLRELICLCRLKQNAKQLGNPTLLTNWNTNHKKLLKKVFYKGIELVSTFLNKYETILKLEQMHQKAMRSNPFYQKVILQIQEVKPDIVFCAHQRAIQAGPIFAAASSLNIETVTVIFSWDNLPKARMAVKADKYLVWSDYMKNELSFYYPEVKSETIDVTGTPQFEFYKDKRLIQSKEVFFAQQGLDCNKKVICFSGDDIKTSPDDPKYLNDIAEEITKANLDADFQILLRRCPVDLSNRFDVVIQKYPKLIKVANPLWKFNNEKDWTTVYPSLEDVALLINTVYHSEFVVNVGSTMAFDFFMFHKPCVFINYDQQNQTDSNWSVKTIYEFQHFKSMPNNEAVFWLNNKEEIVAIIKSYPNFDLNPMWDWTDIILGDSLNSSAKIKQTLN
ncbi:MAG: UDP-glycosyltransferase [Flavobacterium sp.]|nr:UDP-glycosyltransferase [Flavobacterium sp.]